MGTDKKTIGNLIKFALKKKVLTDISGSYSSPQSFDIEEAYEKHNKFLVGSSNEVYDVYFNKPETCITFFREVKRLLPVVEIIDLISAAIADNIITEIVDEKTDKHPFTSYQNDYSVLCQGIKVFAFSFEGETELYRITFNQRGNDIQNKVEYASRTAQFIDLLVKRIMTRYNVLIVHKAAIENAQLEIPRLPCAEEFTVERGQHSSEDESNTIQSQVKMLIRYRDTAQNKTFTEAVIDDVYLTFRDNNPTPTFEYVDIKPGDAEPQYGELEDISDDERKNVIDITNYLNSIHSKYEIFSNIKNNEHSNLHKLIRERLDVYRKESQIPKIEFTISPLSIYSNHIAKRTLIYTIKYNIDNPQYKAMFAEVSGEYRKDYDPLGREKFEFDFEGAEITKDNRLVLAVTNDFVKDGHVEVRLTTEDNAILLSEANSAYYGTDYAGIWFDKSLIYSGNELDYKDNRKNLPFLETDLRPYVFTGRYRHVNDMKEVPKNRVIFDGRTRKGNDMVFVYKNASENWHRCPYCGERWYVEKEASWKNYLREHTIINPNGEARYCCKWCINRKDVEGKNKNVVVLTDTHQNGENPENTENPKKLYFLDSIDKLSSTSYCTACADEAIESGGLIKLKGLIYCGSKAEPVTPPKECASCGRHVCDKHAVTIGDKTYCPRCSGDTPSSRLSSFNDKEARRIWSKVAYNLDLGDGKRKDCTYLLDGNQLWVYANKGKYIKTYYFITDDKKSMFIYKGKVKK